MLTLSIPLIYSNLSITGVIFCFTGFTLILYYLRALSTIYDEPLIWFYARLSALLLALAIIISRLARLDVLTGASYMLGVTLIPGLVDAITLASIPQLTAILLFYSLLITGAYALLRSFELSSIKSREWKLGIVGYSMLITAIAGSTTLLPVLSGFIMVLTSIYGRPREP